MRSPTPFCQPAPAFGGNQPKMRTPMKNRSLRVTALAAGIFATGIFAHAQNTAPVTYDVSTVKPSAPGDSNMMLNWGHAELKARNITLTWIMTTAFHARKDQINGEPAWAEEQHFDINAKLIDTDADTVEKMSNDQHRALLLALLVERFGLKYHVQIKDQPVYDLEPSKRGLKLTPAADSGDKTKQVYGLCSGCASWGNHAVTGHDLELAAFAELLAGQVGRSINDRTGFTGKIDVKLKWAPDLDAKPASEEEAALPPLAQALEEQLGIHLATGRGPVKMYVIDHLDKPSEN